MPWQRRRLAAALVVSLDALAELVDGPERVDLATTGRWAGGQGGWSGAGAVVLHIGHHQLDRFLAAMSAVGDELDTAMARHPAGRRQPTR